MAVPPVIIPPKQPAALKKTLLLVLGATLLFTIFQIVKPPSKDQTSTRQPSASAQPSPSSASAPPVADPNVFTAESMGEKWPFKHITRATVSCIDGRYGIIRSESSVPYALDDSARAAAAYEGFLPLEEIWKDDPSKPGMKMDISPLLARAVELCRSR